MYFHRWWITVSQQFKKKNDFNETDLSENEPVTQIISKFKQQQQKLKDNGLTSQLFLQYIDGVILIMNFYYAERSGKFKLYLECIKHMLDGTGHHNYAKFALFYYQDMVCLQFLVRLTTFGQFANQGFSPYVALKHFGVGAVWYDNWTRPHACDEI